MSDLIEITVETTLRGPLAARLLALSEFAKQPPVEYLADLVQRILKFGWNETPLTELQKLKQENAELKKRVQRMSARMPDPASFVFVLPVGVTVELTREASRRNLQPDELVQKILAHVVTDKLFAAVLDE